MGYAAVIAWDSVDTWPEYSSAADPVARRGVAHDRGRFLAASVYPSFPRRSCVRIGVYNVLRAHELRFMTTSVLRNIYDFLPSNRPRPFFPPNGNRRRCRNVCNEFADKNQKQKRH